MGQIYQILRVPGYVLVEFIISLGEMVILAAQTFWWMFRGKFLTNEVYLALNHIGVQSLPLVSFTALFSGMVLVVQVGNQFMSLGAESFIGGVVGLSLTRELAPLMAATILAARVGSSMAAELGTMKVTEQIDALEVMATNPIHQLVVPRVIACTSFTPILVAYANIVGIIGGLLVGLSQIGCSYSLFMDSLIDMVTWRDILAGLMKSVGFGFIVAIIGCYKGLTTTGGAQGVGQSTTKTVVLIITSILVTNYFFSLAFFAWLKYEGAL